MFGFATKAELKELQERIDRKEIVKCSCESGRHEYVVTGGEPGAVIHNYNYYTTHKGYFIVCKHCCKAAAPEQYNPDYTTVKNAQS